MQHYRSMANKAQKIQLIRYNFNNKKKNEEEKVRNIFVK